MSRTAKVIVSCYCRVSTGSKEQASSLENQTEYFESILKDNKDYKLYKIYADKGISGTKLKREYFDRMLYDAGLDILEVKHEVKTEKDGKRVEYKKYVTMQSGRTPRFEEIWVKNTSRFARNIKVSEILQDLRNNGVYVKFLDIDKTTRDESDISIIQLFQNFDEMFSRDLSKKVIFGNQRSIENGKLRTHPKIYGYHYLKDEGKLILNEKEAEVVRKIFELYDSGHGARVIINKLDALGYKTRQGKKFAPTTIKSIIENEKYAGYINTGKYDTGVVFNKNSYPKVKDEYEMTHKPEIVPPIVDKDLFFRCRDKKRDRASKFSERGVFNGTSKYKGLLFCAKCKSSYTHNIDRGNGYYNCSGKKRKGIASCNATNVPDYFLENFLQTLADGQINDIIEQENIKLLGALFYHINTKIKELEKPTNYKKIQELTEEVEQHKSILKNLYLREAIENTVNSVVKEAIEEVQQKVEKLENDLSRISKKPNAYISDIENMIESVKKVFEFNDSNQEKYSIEEVLEKLLKIIVYGETESNRGGLTPKPFLLPVLKISAFLNIEFEFNDSIEEINSVEELLKKIQENKGNDETKSDRGELPPQPPLPPVLKTFASFNIGFKDYLLSPITTFLKNLGTEDFSYITQAKEYLNEIENTVNLLKIEYL